MPTLNFTVDAALLEELGERLVGRPSTALAELIKNSYDADASLVRVLMDTQAPGKIVVSDNGQGMTIEEFSSLWMRLGSTHKTMERVSRRLRRPLTGSKGVGRIAAQLLSHHIRIESVSDSRLTERLEASLNWDEAVKAGDLVSVQVKYDLKKLGSPASPGTSVVMSKLRQPWTEADVSNLARDVWRLQPPFRPSEGGEDSPSDFEIRFEGTEPGLVGAFQEQLDAFKLIWVAMASGQNEKGEVQVSLQFRGERAKRRTFRVTEPHLRDGQFQLRFYELKYRQPRGVSVGDARKYLEEFGGVLIYDAGFRLPFYGEKDNDWLRISYDTARRLSRSNLLPESLQVAEGMQQLPQWSQVIGQVDVNTSQEPHLKITITRDRLVDSAAYEELRDMVRWAIDWYAMEKARRRLAAEETQADVAAPTTAIRRVTQLLDEYKDSIPKALDSRLRKSVTRALEETKALESQTAVQVATLSSLATAGISSLAYQHELDKQLNAITSLSEKLTTVASRSKDLAPDLLNLRDELLAWATRARQIGRIFSHLTEPENLKEERRFKAREVIEDVVSQIGYLAKAAEFKLANVNADLRLPRATYAEWVSVFQNVFYNAINAMADSRKRSVEVSASRSGARVTILVQDTGVGINLAEADRFFEPFEREVNISPERRELGFGGTGLGLTIVRMICDRRGCVTRFVAPSKGFATAFALEWSEEE